MNFKRAAYVLSLSEQTRNKALIPDLRKNIETKIILGKQGVEFKNFQLGDDAKISQILYNRKLTQNEIACADGHRRLIQQAVSDQVDIAYFLEDDAELPSSFAHLLDDMSLVNPNPTLCLIAYEKKKILCRKIFYGRMRKFYKCYSIPTCAQFYVLNRSALILLEKEWKKRSCAEVADFPTWYWDKVKFYLAPLSQSAVVIRGKSTIGFARFDSNGSNIAKRIKKYLCIFWLFELRGYMSIGAYIAMVHARLIRGFIR